MAGPLPSDLIALGVPLGALDCLDFANSPEANRLCYDRQAVRRVATAEAISKFFDLHNQDITYKKYAPYFLMCSQ